MIRMIIRPMTSKDYNGRDMLSITSIKFSVAYYFIDETKKAKENLTIIL